MLLPSTFADLDTVEKALFGDVAVRYTPGRPGNDRWIRLRNGAWLGETGPRATHVSGLLTAFGVSPGELVASRWPRYWPNPWAEMPVGEALPFPRSTGSAEAVFEHDTEPHDGPRQILGLAAEWPGPEAPFIGLD